MFLGLVPYLCRVTVSSLYICTCLKSTLDVFSTECRVMLTIRFKINDGISTFLFRKYLSSIMKCYFNVNC